MGPDDFFYLGKILRRHGNKGHLLVHLEVDDPQDYQELESVYVDVGHERIPFLVESVEILEKNRAILKLTGVTGADHADAFAGRELYLPLSSLPELKGNRFYFHEVTGFRVIDEIHGEIGIVEEILELPQHPLFQIRSGSKEILVPVVDEVIRVVDRKQKIIRIHAPPGLIELYK